MFSTSSGSLLGSALNHASRISSSSAELVRRSDSASTLASFHLRAPRAVSASSQSAARTPATLLAAIDAPVPVQQQTTPCCARPSATSRAAASLAQAQSARSVSVRAPWGSTSWPREINAATTASATPVRSSAATAILIRSKRTLSRNAPTGRNSRRPDGLVTKDSTHFEPERGPHSAPTRNDRLPLCAHDSGGSNKRPCSAGGRDRRPEREHVHRPQLHEAEGQAHAPDRGLECDQLGDWPQPARSLDGGRQEGAPEGAGRLQSG